MAFNEPFRSQMDVFIAARATIAVQTATIEGQY